MKSRPILLLSAAASLIFLFASPLVASDWTVIFKVASVALLAALGFRVSRLLGTALTFGAAGDFLLGVHRLGNFGTEQLFLFGLGAFLLGHLVYIAMFRKYRAPNWWKPSPARTLGILAVVFALGSVLGVLRNSLGPLLIPVVIYALVLAAMAISALLAEIGNPLAAIGALCFVASDAMLAIAKFRGPFAGHEPLIWISYYLAQLLIFLGVTRAKLRSSNKASRAAQR
ncbi:MAG TPA: lysoplasmalogenase [Candidatus Bathyarchaeia archaeon]|nr:lysoplasmalogenase [Candidatus Bathyarchaeia archaeon]